MAISGNLRGLYAPFLAALGDWNWTCGNRYSVYIGVRTWEEQQRLYDLYVSGQRPILAAKPGPMARHLYGLAVDVRPNPVSAADAARLADFGGVWEGRRWRLLMDVPGEPWHIYPSHAARLIESGICQPIHEAETLAASGLPYLRRGARGPLVRAIQGWALSNFPSYAKPTIGAAGGADGEWGAGTNAWLVEFCRRVGLVPPDTGPDAAITIGPKVWAAFAKYGFRAPIEASL